MTGAEIALGWLRDAFAVNALSATLLAGLALVAGRFIRRPALRHALWLLVLLDLLTPPVLRFALLPSEAPAEPPAIVAEHALEGPTSIGSVAGGLALGADTDPGPAIVPSLVAALEMPFALVAAFGSIGIALLGLARLRRFDRLVSQARPASAHLTRRARRLARRLGLARTPTIRLTAARIPPLVALAHRSGPVVLLPAGLVARLEEDQLDAVLAHELAHVARRDHWVRVIELATTVLYWWHPALWLARRALRRAEERACDARVVAAFPRLAGAYARVLIETLSFLAVGRHPVPHTTTASDPRHDLEERLTMILHRRTSPPLHPALRFALVGAGALALFVIPVRAGSGTDEPVNEPVNEPVSEVHEAAGVIEPERERALEERMRALEEQARDLAEQQLELERAQRAMHLERAEIEAQAERLALEARARELESHDRLEDAERLRQKAMALEKHHALRIERQRIEQQSRESFEHITQLREQKAAVERLHRRGGAEATAAMREALRALENQRLDLEQEQVERLTQIEKRSFQHAQELMERARAEAEAAGDAQRLAELSSKQQALEARARLERLEAQGHGRSLALERQVGDRKRAYEALVRADEMAKAKALRRQTEAMVLRERVQITADRLARQHELGGARIEGSLRELILKLEGKRDRTTSDTESRALDDQIRALEIQLDRIETEDDTEQR